MGAGSYELAGRGSDLVIRVTGSDVEACLAAAVEGLAASLADVDAAPPARREEIALRADSPQDLLVELVDEAILRLDADGELPVALVDAHVHDHSLEAGLMVVPLDRLEVHGVAPKAATWHDVALEATDEGWRGEVMLDL